jgi:alpha-tubulin suppressor-like RCC1 family protein
VADHIRETATGALVPRAQLIQHALPSRQALVYLRADPYIRWNTSRSEMDPVRAKHCLWVGVAMIVLGTTTAHSVAAAVSRPTLRSGFVSLSPVRVLDTRPSGTTVDGRFTRGGPIGPGSTVNLDLAGRGGLPDVGIGAVVVNVTVTSPTADGYITVWPSEATRPNASNVNFVKGDTVPNLVISQVSTYGQLLIFNSAGSTHLVVDVMGWFPDGGSFTGLTPARLLDTRLGRPTIDAQFQAIGARSAASETKLAVAGRGGVPATGAAAVVVNVTATEPTQDGFVTIWPSGEARPNASNLNFVKGDTVPNLAVVKLGADGQISLFNSAGSTHLVVDVMGWFPITTPVFPTTPMISMGAENSCVLKAAGIVRCWGANDAYQLGRNAPVPGSSTPITVAGLSDIISVDAGGGFTCALTSSGTVYCLGAGLAGQLGTNALGNTSGPARVMNLSRVTSISAGLRHACALLVEGTVRCWGGGNPVLGPITVDGISGATTVLAGSGFSCAVLSDRTVRCWGSNEHGELGNGLRTDSNVPVVVTGLNDVAALGGGYGYTCAVLVDGTVRCWGFNGYGNLGNGTTVDASTPVKVAGVSGATAVTAGEGHACALLSDATVRCWGDNLYGKLGVGIIGGSLTPVSVTALSNATEISAGAQHTCARLADGDVRCWGGDGFGVLGHPNPIAFNTFVPTSVVGL